MQIKFQNKTVLVGGGSSGIGFAIAKMFSENDANVVILGRDENKLKEKLNLLNSQSNLSHDYLVTNFEDSNKLEYQLKNFIETKKLKFDIVVNNVGGSRPNLLFDIEQNEFEQNFRKQFLSFHIITKTCSNYMIERGYGRIINILGTSVKSTISSLGLSAFKSTVLSWAKTLSEEIGSYGITVNNILPGPTDTKELSDIIETYSKQTNKNTQILFENLKTEIPLNRIANPKEIAYVVLFLASEYSSFINGSNVTVDGGYSKILF